MENSDASVGPLAHQWGRLEEMLQQVGTFNVVEISIVRLAFYYGARCAIAAAHRPMAMMLLASEIRAFDKEVMHDAAQTEPAPAGGSTAGAPSPA